MNLKKHVLSYVLSMPVVVVAAVNAELCRQDVAAHQVYWCDEKNWIDAESRQPLSEPPTNASDNVFLPDPNKNVYLQRIGIGVGEPTSNSRSITVGSVAGNHRHKICHTFKWQESQPAPRKRLTVLNPDGFTGLWFAGDAHAVFSFPATASFSPRISALSANARPEVEIPDAGTRARLGALYNGGALIKRGGGELAVGGTRGADVRLYVEQGALTLEGRPDGETRASLIAKAAMHLDATAVDSLQKLPADETGRTPVSEWADVRGNGLAASVPSSSSRLKVINRPFITRDPYSGLDMVDFGSVVADEESVGKWGPTNCIMKFTRMENVREVFYAVRYHLKPGFNAVLGDNVYPTLQPADCLLGGSANFGARTGDIYANGTRIDGKWWPDGGHGLTNVNVVSVGSPSNMVFSTIASEQEFSDRTGGMMIGEIILYTNELTRVERMRVHQYLCDKWLRKAFSADVDAGQVFLQGGEASSLGVSSGAEASVVDVIAGAGGRVVKTGGGTLQIDTLYPFNAVIDVRGGSVRFARVVPEVTTDAPAVGPSVWLDATAAGSYVTEGGEGEEENKSLVSWADRRGGENAVRAVASEKRPTVVPSASPTGLDVIDFGSSSATHSYVKFPWWGEASARKFKAGFAVIRQLNGDRTFVPYFGSKDFTFMREGSAGGIHCRFVAENYTHPALGAAVWTLDGVPQDPTVYNRALADTSSFKVVAFSAGEDVLVDAIAFARNNPVYCGGMQVGEFLLYDRELTDGERRSTEAYLMKRWLGADHPASALPAPACEFADDTDAVVDSDVDINVVSVSGGSGKLVKRGAGNVCIEQGLAVGQVSEISVSGGRLRLPVVRTFMDEALFHFDASDAESLVYAVDGDGREYLSEWLDVRRNGMKAVTVLDDAAGHVKCAPSLVELEVRPGVRRGLLDFGGVLGGSAAAMIMNASFANFREGHTIHKDRSSNSMFFSHSHLNPAAGSQSNYNDFYRVSDRSTFFGGSAAEGLKNGYIATNGAPVEAYTDEVPREVTLFSMASTAAAHVNSIQYDRTVPGGAYVGEQIAFSRVLNEDERTYLQRYLMWKWFGEGEKPVWPELEFDSLSVADGAALDLPARSTVVAGSLSGAGEISCGTICGVAGVSLRCEDAADGRFLSVSGEVDFAGELTVELVGDGGIFEEGDYTVFEATAIGRVPDVIRLDASGVASAKQLKLVRDGNCLVLRVLPKGMRIIVK